MMKKNYFCFLMFIGIIHAQQAIEVSADHIITDQTTGKSIISGNVRVQRQKDHLSSNEMILYFDPQTHKPTQYEAYGNVVFQITSDDGRLISGKADKAIFVVATDTYKLLGNAFVEEVGKNNQIRGNTISLSRQSGFVNIEGGSNKPARVIFLYDHQSKQPVIEGMENMDTREEKP